MLHGSSAQVNGTARHMRALGVDRVRLTASWSTLAPAPTAKRKPRFDARSPEAYPPAPWSQLDRAVKAVVGAGLEPQIDIAFFAPRWAVSRVVRTSHPNRHRWKPNPEAFGQFAEAVARRYTGAYRDPARPTQRLPAVRLWTTWNEPNHGAFLLPQWERVDGAWSPRSPHIYRTMHERAYAAINGVEDDNRVLLGGTAAIGDEGRGPRKAMSPILFLRELACVDRRGRPLERAECAGFKPLEADGFAHHPYSLFDSPDARSANPDDVAMGDLARLSRALDGLHRLGRITTRLPIYVTEYGYETNPPDVVRGVSVLQQARYHGLATFLAWRQNDVSTFAQFLLNDIGPPPGADTPIEASKDWHSGLYFHDGRPKPEAVQAFKLPFWAESRSVAGRDLVVFFGQVRPSTGRQRVELEMRGPNDTWVPVTSYDARPPDNFLCGDETTGFLTDTQGFYLRLAPYERRARYRARWLRADGKSEYGVTVPVGRPDPPATDS